MRGTIAAALYEHARIRGDRPFLHLLGAKEGRTIGYAELLAGSQRVAQFLQANRVGSRDVVFCIFDTGLPLLFSFFGAVLAGAVPAILAFPTPKLDPAEYRRRLRLVTEYSRPAAVLTYPQLHGEVTTMASGYDFVKLVATWEQVEDVITGVGFEPAGSTLADSGSGAVLQYSSGTTGLQKGVLLSHAAITAHIESYAEALRLADDDTIVSWLPLYHDMGLIAALLLPVLTGTPLVLMSPFDWVVRPAALLKAISTHRATLTWLPNFAFNFLATKVRDEELAGVQLDSLRAVINCSEPMRVESHEMFVDRYSPLGLRPGALATCYAMAENTFAVTQGGIDGPPHVDVIDGGALTREWLARKATPGSPRSRQVLSAGRPIRGVDLQIVNEEGRALPPRSVGQIAIRSPFVLTEYYRRPDLTASAMSGEWFLTGDFGYLAEGELYVTGRKKDLIIVGGANLYPQDIEAAVDEVHGIHPGRTAAFGIPDASGTEAIAVVAEIESWAVADKDRVVRSIRDQVARATDCVVRHIRLVERGWILKTSSGKVARQANKDKYCREAGIHA